MIMGVPQEKAMRSRRKSQTLILLKGKRTKRRRLMPPFSSSKNTNSSSSAEPNDSFGDLSLYSGVAVDRSGAADGTGADRVTSSPSDSYEFTQSTVVNNDEDLASCLILLAQGRSQKATKPPPNGGGTDNSGIGGDVYQCKTCNRSFSSFQALGGHRASHKKPKGIQEENKRSENLQEYDVVDCTSLSLQIPSYRDSRSPNKKSGVHECSICGAKFTSGQALGGHMRRHRPIHPARPPSSSFEDSLAVKKTRSNALELDLNLPAPEHDELESKFAFESKENVLGLSASSLIRCHY